MLKGTQQIKMDKSNLSISDIVARNSKKNQQTSS